MHWYGICIEKNIFQQTDAKYTLNKKDENSQQLNVISEWLYQFDICVKVVNKKIIDAIYRRKFSKKQAKKTLNKK